MQRIDQFEDCITVASSHGDADCLGEIRAQMAVFIVQRFIETRHGFGPFAGISDLGFLQAHKDTLRPAQARSNPAQDGLHPVGKTRFQHAMKRLNTKSKVSGGN